MEPKLTLEIAFKNIAVVVEAYRGTKQEHIALDQALTLVNETLFKKDVAIPEVVATTH